MITIGRDDEGMGNSRPAPDTGDHSGNPPGMVRLKDGRLAITYGHRSPPFEMRARLNSDGGKTWGQEILLRGGAGAWDIGYPRTVQRADGKLVTAYLGRSADEGARHRGYDLGSRQGDEMMEPA